MNKTEMLAVVNNDCILVSPFAFYEFMEGDYDGDFARIAECLTEKVTGDSRFINAIGVEKAKNAHFHIEIFGSECEECNNLDTFLAIKMDIAGEDTAFYLEYEMVQCGRHEGIAPQRLPVEANQCGAIGEDDIRNASGGTYRAVCRERIRTRRRLAKYNL